jgi:hypothetical protein
MMNSIARNLISTGLITAAAIMTQLPAATRAEDKRAEDKRAENKNEKPSSYWRDHWRWYDSTYHPYYHRRSTLYVPPLPPDDPRVTGSYGPYWGPYFGGTVAYGPGIQYGWW